MQRAFAAVSAALFLQNATLIDPRTQTAETASLLLRNGKVEARLAADAPPPADAQVIPLKGKYVLPGLADLHVHSWGNPTPVEGGKDDEGDRAVMLARMLYAGVTAALDLGSNPDVIFGLRDRQRMNPDEVPGASLFAAGPVLGPWAMPDPEAARARVNELAARRPDVVKILFDSVWAKSGGMSREIVAAAVAEAKKHGLKTVVHIGTWKDASDAIEGGASAITHLYDPEPISEALARRMHELGVVEIPTMAVQGDLYRISRNLKMLDDPLLVAVTPPWLRDDYRKPRKTWKERARNWVDWQKVDTKFDFISMRRLRQAKVEVLTGSDAANFAAFQGYSAHREMEIFQEAGFTAWEALAAGTTRAAEFLGLRYGVRPGDLAELVVLGASPLDAVGNTKRIEGVIHLGRYWGKQERETLRSRMGLPGVKLLTK